MPHDADTSKESKKRARAETATNAIARKKQTFLETNHVFIYLFTIGVFPFDCLFHGYRISVRSVGTLDSSLPAPAKDAETAYVSRRWMNRCHA